MNEAVKASQKETPSAASFAQRLELGDASSMQRSFASMLTSVPASMRKLVQGESSKVGGLEGSKRFHPNFYILKEGEDICGGMVGSGGKACVRPKASCGVAKHARDRVDLAAGCYLCSGAEDVVFLEASIPGYRITKAVEDRIYAQPEMPLEEANVYISNLAKTLSMEDVKMEAPKGTGETKIRKSDGDPGIGLSRKSRKLSLLEKHSLLETTLQKNPDNTGEETLHKNLVLRDIYVRELSEVVQDTSEDIQLVQERVLDVTAQIGTTPNMAPPGLWLGYLELRGEVDRLKSELPTKASVGVETTVGDVLGRVEALDREISELDANTGKGYVGLLASINILKQSANQHASQNNGGMTGGNLLPDDLPDRVEKLERLMVNMARADKPSNTSIRVGKYCFESIEDLAAWSSQHLPANYPFGAFVDFYSFMQRIKSFRDASDSENLRNMDYRNKLSLTTDEATTMAAFMHPLPKGFRGTANEEAQMHDWIPGLKSPDKWENEHETAGMKVTIKDNTEVVRARVEAVIGHRLANKPEATSLAMELLADTITFSVCFSSFVSTTYRTLNRAGFGKTGAWNLVQKLMHRIFATDCFMKRGISAELLDANDHKSLGVSILWGTLGTHQTLREYQKHGIENHPSIASEYVRFLVAHSGVQKVEKLTLRCESLESDLKKMTRLLEAAQKMATTASNKAEEALKAARASKKKASPGNQPE